MDLLLNNEFFFLDSHTHFFDDISKTIVSPSIICGTSIIDWDMISQLNGSTFNKAYGIHPWYIDNNSIETLPKLEKLLISQDECIIGEVGLDFSRDNRELQEAIFCKQLEFAEKHKKNIIIHCVKAWHRVIHLIEKYIKDESINIMFHGYNASIDITSQLIKNKNYYFSFSPKSNLVGLELIPENKLLVESDCDCSNNRNYSTVFKSNITRVSKKSQIDLKTLSEISQKNFYAFLK